MYKDTQSVVDDHANNGLRTLFVAERVLSQDMYDKWADEIAVSNALTSKRDEALAANYEVAEKELTLIGSTAIEDRLQDEVADTIRFMKRTGIKVWVLTGDKVGTAINIGISAGLLDRKDKMDQHLVDGKDDSIENQLERAKKDITAAIQIKAPKKQAIIVAGDCLTKIDADKDGMLRTFQEASDLVDVVLACRVSPKQKADIVMMIRGRYPDKVTLAIGDGANDVNMILSSHVGVGILGKEG